MPVNIEKIEFFGGATPQLAFTLFPKSDQALPVHSVQSARANRQRLWQGPWQPVTYHGVELLVGETFKKSLEM